MLNILFIIAGIITIVCSIRNDDWIIEPKGRRYVTARFLNKHFGRNAVRIYYICLGIFIIVLGILLLFGK